VRLVGLMAGQPLPFDHRATSSCWHYLSLDHDVNRVLAEVLVAPDLRLPWLAHFCSSPFHLSLKGD
jgi:hypothetical protein